MSEQMDHGLCCTVVQAVVKANS